MRRRFVKFAGGAVLIFVVLLTGAWFAFVPSAREPGYRFVAAWAEKGAGPGQFHDPTGIAIAGNEVFVADARNGRIQVFDLEGNYLRAFGRPGKKPTCRSRSTSAASFRARPPRRASSPAAAARSPRSEKEGSPRLGGSNSSSGKAARKNKLPKVVWLS